VAIGVAERIERLCTLLSDDDLRVHINGAGVDAVLTRILAAVKDGRHDSALERDLDALDDATAKSGLGPVTRPVRIFYPAPAAGSGHPVVHAWACPAARRCTRVERVGQAAQPPVCAATSGPMALVRVPT
jgi:hypothetical protein